MKTDMSRHWSALFVTVLLIKSIAFLLDPIPKLFFGDSGCYLYTALEGWAPEDRSFTYGYLIAPLLETFQSLTPVLLLQTAASTITVFLLGVSLVRHFNVRPQIAWGAALLCSIEPIQLLYERFVMTEALSLFFFAIYVFLAIEYLCHKRAWLILLLQLAGVLSVSLRLSYLPAVMGSAVLVPLLGGLSARPARTPKAQRSASEPVTAWKRLRPTCVTIAHLAMSVAVMVSLHSGLKRLYAELSGYPPGYNASEGYFLLATWAPVVIPEDFPLVDVRRAIFDQPTFDLKDRLLRTQQLFDYDGLCWRIRIALEEIETEGEDSEKNGVANELAGATAMNALKRDPAGVIRLSFQNLGDYFDVNLIRRVIDNDLAMDAEQMALYRRFVYDTLEAMPGMLDPTEQPMTLLKRYYRAMLPWYWLLLATPILCAATLVLTEGIERLLTIEALLLISTCAAVAGLLSILPIVRYLHPLAWLAFYPLALVADRWTRPLKRPRNRLRELR